MNSSITFCCRFGIALFVRRFLNPRIYLVSFQVSQVTDQLSFPGSSVVISTLRNRWHENYFVQDLRVARKHQQKQEVTDDKILLWFPELKRLPQHECTNYTHLHFFRNTYISMTCKLHLMFSCSNLIKPVAEELWQVLQFYTVYLDQNL